MAYLSRMGNSSSNLRILGFNSSLETKSSDVKSLIELQDDIRAIPVSTTKNLPSLKASSDNFGRNCVWRIMLASIKTTLFSDKINLLLPCGPLAMLVDQLTDHQGWVFLLSLLGIIPLAERLGWATEQLVFYTGPTVGGLLNATFGNATELIISLFAMKQGMFRLVQQSLLGSILSNMLLVLGCAFFCGGIANCNKEQLFNRSNAGMNVGLLLMAVMSMLFPTVLNVSHTEFHIGTSVLALSRFSSCIMLIAYGIYIFFQLTNQKQNYALIKEDGTLSGSPDDESADISKMESLIWLGLLTIFISVLSEYLVNAIEGASLAMDVPVTFISVILLPIVGNAAEHACAITFAVKDKLMPFCVLVGWMIGRPMDLNFEMFETCTLFMTVLVVAFMLQEGTSNYFKGLMLLFCYTIVAASFFVHVDPVSIRDIKQITDVRFEVKHLVHSPLRRLYYCKVGTPLRLGIKEIKNDDDVQAFLTVGYETKWVVDMYAEHLDDDAFDIRDFAEANNVDLGNESSDAYCSSDEEDYGDVEFFNEGDENVQIRVVTTKDPFLLKLCSNSGHYKGFIDEPVNELTKEVINDPDNIDPKYRAKSGIIYPRHDPSQQWDKMEPVLGMRFESNEQLKLALANYGVANGYQLWFMRNDWKQLLVYCGRDVQSGRCAGAPTIKKRKQDRIKKNSEGSSKDGEGCSTIVVGCSNDGESTSKSPNKVSKKGRVKRKSVRAVDKDKNVCGFRLFASWMSTEMSFQIKSLKPKHRCSRNYNLGSLVTYKWIAHQYAKELIADPFMPLLKMKTDIRAKYHLNVSIGQCLRAKQRALFDYEGGLKEHYARIWEYRNAVLDTNPGSTCRVDDEETSSGNNYFRRFYVCFKGVRDGWFAGCRKIGGDGGDGHTMVVIVAMVTMVMVSIVERMVAAMC
ncbi:calcium/proton exchanger [Artemisia annua]|uniref:Calcium/proton exchanger n=1 Tax=Artemisia annua TaxID=35608 RepID=A0A2U1P580_ARTAN|nr:calcium/proton exchanger [Artemisia annua]